jgi:hypothetical protein
MMVKAKLGSSILVGALLTVVFVTCVWFWNRPRWEVTVTGTIAAADVAEITQVVQREFVRDWLQGREIGSDLSLLDRLGFTQLLAKIGVGETTRYTIEIKVRPDGTVEAEAAHLCPGGFCPSGAGYELRRGPTGWEATPTHLRFGHSPPLPQP